MTKASKIRDLLQAGANYGEIIRATGAAKSTIAYHAKRLGLSKSQHDWVAIQHHYANSGETIHETMRAFGVHRSTFFEAKKKGLITLDPTRERAPISNDVIFVENSPFDSGVVRNRVIRGGLLPYVCETEDCPVHEKAEWMGKPLSLHLDHKNGRRNDHRITNLRWLCPSCHSLTDTYCGRNKGR